MTQVSCSSQFSVQPSIFLQGFRDSACLQLPDSRHLLLRDHIQNSITCP